MYGDKIVSNKIGRIYRHNNLKDFKSQFICQTKL